MSQILRALLLCAGVSLTSSGTIATTVALTTALSAGAARATEPMMALARPDIAASSVNDFGADVQIQLKLSQPVLWRVFTLDEPMRLVLEFGDVDWSGAEPVQMLDSDAVTAVRTDRVEPGWSRLIFDLAKPLKVETAGMTTGAIDGSAALKLQLAPVGMKEFAAAARSLEDLLLQEAPGAVIEDEGPLTIVLDPGHGGIDPGALAENLTEADLMLAFARELCEAFTAEGVHCVLTRDADIFIPLETRVSIAREAGADAFISLHADALAEGRASGATVYTLSRDAQEAASQKLAERHQRDDLLAGIDLTRHDDQVAKVLMTLARAETQPRADRLADAIVEGLGESTGNLHKRPRLSAGFSVLKAADIPSVLVELGFLSNETDRGRIASAEWRAKAAEGIVGAVIRWAEEDREIRKLARQ